MKAARAIFTSTLTIALCLSTTAARSQTCTDIGYFDLRNATIEIEGHDENELRTVFNEPNIGPFSFHLHDGKAFDDDSTQEFQAELVSNQLVHPDKHTWIRIILLENDHLKGTGTWRDVMAFTCKDRRLIKLFQFSSEGVSLKHVDDKNIRLYQAIWAEHDVHTTPTMSRELLFTWDTKEQRYRRTFTSSIK